MMTQKKHHKRNLSFLLTLLAILGLTMLPQPLLAQALRIVYTNDNLGELAPCG